MTAAPDQWSWWRDALAGKSVDSEVGSPRSGFWKASRDEPIAIWRDDDGKVCCERVMFGGGERMSLDKIDELYASASRYPLDEATYDAARRGEPPLGYKTRLSVKECQAGVMWSLELGRKKLGAEVAPAEPPQSDGGTSLHTMLTALANAPDNPRAVIGDNRPPVETPAEAPVAEPVPVGHTFAAAERTPDLILTEEVSALGAQVKVWLDSIGGAPRDKAEADIAADYKTKFAALEKKADKARVDEKQPHLDAGRDVDDRWRRPISNAKASKEKCGTIAQDWRNAENARREAAAAIANKEAADAAAKASQQYQAPIDPPAPVQAERVGSLGNTRSVAERAITRWQVDDPRAYATHILAQPGDLPAEIVEALGKVASRRAEEAPGVSKHVERKAA